MKLLDEGKITKGELKRRIREKTDVITSKSRLELRPNQVKVFESLVRQAVESIADDISNTKEDGNSDTIKINRLREIEEEMKALEQEKLNLLYDDK